MEGSDLGEILWGRKVADITLFGSLNMSQVWKDVVSVGKGSERLVSMLLEGFKWEVGNGSYVDFWGYKWVRYKSLKNLFPRFLH